MTRFVLEKKGGPAYRQLYAQLKDAIAAGSTRWRCSRTRAGSSLASAAAFSCWGAARPRRCGGQRWRR